MHNYSSRKYRVPLMIVRRRFSPRECAKNITAGLMFTVRLTSFFAITCLKRWINLWLLLQPRVVPTRSPTLTAEAGRSRRAIWVAEKPGSNSPRRWAWQPPGPAIGVGPDLDPPVFLGISIRAPRGSPHAFIDLKDRRGVKLTEADVREIRALRASGVELKPIAKRFGVSTSAIYLAATGRTWVASARGRASLQAGEVTGGAPQEQAGSGHRPVSENAPSWGMSCRSKRHLSIARNAACISHKFVLMDRLGAEEGAIRRSSQDAESPDAYVIDNARRLVPLQLPGKLVGPARDLLKGIEQ